MTNKTMFTKIRGITFMPNIKDIIKTVKVGDLLLMYQEENNKFDKNAIYLTNIKGNRLGYLSRTVAEHISKKIKKGKKFKVEITNIYVENLGINIKISDIDKGVL